MATPLGMLDMAVEAISNELCKDCKKKLEGLQKTLKEKKIKWFKDQFLDQD